MTIQIKTIEAAAAGGNGIVIVTTPNYDNSTSPMPNMHVRGQ